MFRRSMCIVALVSLAAAARAEGPKKAELPLKKVVLFSSGVGFFEHFGKVEGDASVEMKFNVEDVNDLLKSMVVQDLDGGKISTVTYGSKDPITKTLKSFSIDLTVNPTLADLLRQVRGERVILDAPNEIAGVILGVETRKKQLNDDEIIEIDVLNLLTDDGLRAVPLESVGRIKLANEELDAELRKALAVLASAHATDKKSVGLSFLGKGVRRVWVGYIQETPVWKTTYRLVLSDDAKPLLQGWAIVENTSEEDWNNVQLKLVSGRPISFTMDLYEPLYLPRPEEQLELFASLRPQVYEKDMDAKKEAFGYAGKPAAAPTMAFARKMRSSGEGRGMAEGMADKLEEVEDKLNFRQGVSSAAAAGEVGNLFQYAIATPVTLPRQQSAMLPIVAADVKCEKVSIYNPAVQAKHPLYGARFTNTTDLHLMQGPITVFDDGVYAGDAKIADVAPGDQRLISYGLDLETEVVPSGKSMPEELLGVKIAKGTLIATRKFVRSVEYTVKNSGKQPKTVLIESPIQPDWALVKPKEPTEKTRSHYRFAVEAKPGAPAALMVEEQRTLRQSVALTNLSQKDVQLYLSSKVVGEKVKAALAEVAGRQHALRQVAAERMRCEGRIAAIEKDQSRIRENMTRLDRNSDVFKRYVKKFNDQETEIEKLRDQIAELSDKEIERKKSLDEYMMGLDLE
ncbi:MAG: DUF4139 domain-containing protein [Pirellulales bacterium]|nr:DUF4139 domain-containing protein [Pirellulales bacterium]